MVRLEGNRLFWADQFEMRIQVLRKVVSHGRYVTFQVAEVAVSRQMFANILSLTAPLRTPPAPV